MVPFQRIIDIPLISRDILPSILPWIPEREAIFLVGTRQAGKTSLLYLICQHLHQQNLASDQNLCFLDLEDPQDLELARLSPQNLINALKLKGKRWDAQNRLYLFLDEIHLHDDPSRFVKLLVDHHPDISLIATGSSSTSIREKFKDSLPGRKQEFLLSPLNFGEYLEFVGKKESRAALTTLKMLFEKPDDLLSDSLGEAFVREIERDYWDYAVFSGYPAVALTQSEEMKRRRLGAIFNDYVRKDLGTLFSVSYLEEFTRLVRMLAGQIGGILNYSHLSSNLRLNQRTVQRYLSILEETYIVSRVQALQKNVKKRLVKSPKVYFHDTGIRNMALGDFSAFDHRTDRGSLVENTVFQSLVRNLFSADFSSICFWRTSAGAEVDFVPDDILVEVKSGDFAGNPPRGLLNCMDALKREKAVILNKSRIGRWTGNDQEVIFYPYVLLQ